MKCLTLPRYNSATLTKANEKKLTITTTSGATDIYEARFSFRLVQSALEIVE